MRWLAERGGPLGRFSQSMLVGVPGGLREADLQGALQAVLDHHDALRLRLDAGSEDEEWRLEIMPGGSVSSSGCLRRVDVSAIGGKGVLAWDGPELRARIGLEAAAAEGRLDPAAGAMVQAVWFDAGAACPGRLWLSIHHLAVDGVSWRILLPDLEAAWRAIAAGQTAVWPPNGTSFRRWAELLCAHALKSGLRDELAFWVKTQSEPSLLLTQGKLEPERDTLGTAGHLTLRLPSAVTQALLTRVPAAFHGGINDVLLTALTLSVADWCRRHVQGGGARNSAGGSHALLLDLEGHGREEGVFAGVDLTRTVGWFTSLYPVRLDAGRLDLDDALAGGVALGRAFKTIKEQLRAVPSLHGEGQSQDDVSGYVSGYVPGYVSRAGAAKARGLVMGCYAISTPRRRESLPVCRRRRSASTIWAGLPVGVRTQLGMRPGMQPGLRCWTVRLKTMVR